MIRLDECTSMTSVVDGMDSLSDQGLALLLKDLAEAEDRIEKEGGHSAEGRRYRVAEQIGLQMLGRRYAALLIKEAEG
jgi:hypothetical protein